MIENGAGKPSASTQDFAGDILVVCPRCGRLGHVLGGVRLTCPACSLRQIRARPRRFGAIGASYEQGEGALADWHGAFTLVDAEPPRCSTCGDRLILKPGLKTVAKAPAAAKSHQEMPCSACGAVNRVATIWAAFFTPAEAREPYFGCRLFLVEETAKGTVWAYNLAHALALREWISADLRRSGAGAGSRSMTALLPRWMKAAANRGLVSKALDRMLAAGEAL